MAGQGRRLTQFQINTIIALLSRTEMSFADIAYRLGCSRSAIVKINREHCVRRYGGKHSQWELWSSSRSSSNSLTN
jgi:IS30 family transposase